MPINHAALRDKRAYINIDETRGLAGKRGLTGRNVEPAEKALDVLASETLFGRTDLV